MSHYPKKNIINVGVLCCPPLPPTPPPLPNSNLSCPRASRSAHFPDNFHLLLSPPRIHPHLQSTNFSHDHVILSCHCVMSDRHVILSYTYTHILTNLIRIHLDNIYVTRKQYNSTLSNI